ncbi:hypothetical protein UFOVP1605_3 [uncultured Caudovirales phage]|uniref:Uncharacterized protein n=1 Tax=uncultured Caudovirales phage TaxID=2100421 RepID=A0A6J5SS24_9CAUD|nr:hypothetical protein UFOVP1605_3 [uncultured Caudovirales phage]
MREYSSKISLIKNSRGIYILDTSIGCAAGMKETKGGCYGDCYAAKSANQYGYDFTKTKLRHFQNKKHEREIVFQISKIKLDFVRIGGSGDPSENWEHCINVLKVIANCNKQIVIITRHWTNLSDEQLQFLNTINVCVNTSVSALDSNKLISNSLEQYKRLKPYCKSVLRIVSCDFNLENEEGKRLSEIQHELFKNENTLDTIFRPAKNNHFVASGIVNIKVGIFNGHKAIISKFNKKTFAGKCSSCIEMCGVNIGKQKLKKPIYTQALLFNKKTKQNAI